MPPERFSNRSLGTPCGMGRGRRNLAGSATMPLALGVQCHRTNEEDQPKNIECSLSFSPPHHPPPLSLPPVTPLRGVTYTPLPLMVPPSSPPTWGFRVCSACDQQLYADRVTATRESGPESDSKRGSACFHTIMPDPYRSSLCVASRGQKRGT